MGCRCRTPTRRTSPTSTTPVSGNWRGEDWALLATTRRDHRRRELTREIVAFRRRGRLYRRSEETHRLRLYPATEVAAELRRIGFRTRILRGYGDLRFDRDVAGFCARKPWKLDPGR